MFEKAKKYFTGAASVGFLALLARILGAAPSLVTKAMLFTLGGPLIYKFIMRWEQYLSKELFGRKIKFHGPISIFSIFLFFLIWELAAGVPLVKTVRAFAIGASAGFLTLGFFKHFVEMLDLENFAKRTFFGMAPSILMGLIFLISLKSVILSLFPA